MAIEQDTPLLDRLPLEAGAEARAARPPPAAARGFYQAAYAAQIDETQVIRDYVPLVKRLALEAGAFAAEVNEGFTKGGAGVADLATAVVEACEQPNTFHQIYQDDEPIQDKIEAIARNVYGAKDVYYYPEAEAKIGQFTREGLGHFPVCMAKTHLSLSADPTLLNAPENFTLPVRDIRVLFALTNKNYAGFMKHQLPHAHEYYAPMETLMASESDKNPALQALLADPNKLIRGAVLSALQRTAR